MPISQPRHAGLLHAEEEVEGSAQEEEEVLPGLVLNTQVDGWPVDGEDPRQATEEETLGGAVDCDGGARRPRSGSFGSGCSERGEDGARTPTPPPHGEDQEGRELAQASPSRGRLHFLVPPLLSRGSLMSLCSSSQNEAEASPRLSARRSLSIFSSSRDDPRNVSRPSSREESRRSFLIAKDEQEMLQRLAAVGVRGSTASELTDLSLSNDRQCCGSCCHRIRRARLQVWLFLEEPFQTFTASLASCTMVLILFASILSSLYLHQGACASCASAPEPTIRGLDTVFNHMDTIFNLIFCADFVLRAWAFPMPWRFLRHPRNAIDLASVLPFLFNDVLALPARLPGLGFLQWLDTYEPVLRLLKLSRYFWGWQLLFHAVSESAKALAIPLFFLLLIVMLGSCTLYVFEAAEAAEQGADVGGAEVAGCETGQVSIRNLLDAVHFSVVCILSMSTGPFYCMQAESLMGRATVCALMAFGMMFMAMPIAIVGSCFSQTWFDQDRILLLEMVRSRLQAQGFTPQDIRDVFDEVDQNHSGEVEFCEFRTMIRTFNLRSLNATKCRRLFHYFDNDGDGVISFMDFALTLYPDLPVEDDSDDQDDKESSGESVDADTPRKTSGSTGPNRKKKGSAQGYIETVVVPWAQPRGSHSRPQSLRSNRSLVSRGASLKSKGGSLLGMTSMGSRSSAKAAGANAGRPLAEASLSGCVPSESNPPAEVSVPCVEELPRSPELVQPDGAGSVPDIRFTESVPAALASMAPDGSLDSRVFSPPRWSCTSQGTTQSFRPESGSLAREDCQRDALAGCAGPLEGVLHRLDRLESQLEHRFDRVMHFLTRHGGGSFSLTFGRAARADAFHANRSMPASARASRRPSLSQPLSRPAPPPAGPSRLAPPRSKPRTLVGWSAMQEPAEGVQVSPRPSQ